MRYLKSSEEFINESFFGKVKDFFSKDKEFDKTPEEKYKELVGLIIDFVYDKESEFYLSINTFHVCKKELKEIKEKEFDTVTTFRKIKEQISNDLTGKSFEQIKEYLRVNSLKINSN